MRRFVCAAVVHVLACGGGGDPARSSTDAGPDAGRDASLDASLDAGADASPDAGTACDALETEPAILTPGSPAEDEDPSVLLARDGSLFVAFFSNRDGNADVFVVRSEDGVVWSDPVRVTTHPDADFAPSLVQDDAGALHLAWFRRMTADPFFVHVRAARSEDGVTWTDEVAVTGEAGPIDDWVPALAAMPDGTLLVVFASSYRAPPLWALWATSSADGTTWEEPTRLELGGAENDHLPFLARLDDGLAMTWVRYEDTSRTPWEDPSADVMVSRSADGVTWDPPIAVTDDDAAGVLDVFSTLFARHDGAWHLAWVSSAAPAGVVLDLPLAEAGTAAEPVSLPLPGYSPRITATSIPCQYLGTWVSGPIGAQDVRFRLFTDSVFGR